MVGLRLWILPWYVLIFVPALGFGAFLTVLCNR